MKRVLSILFIFCAIWGVSAQTEKAPEDIKLYYRSSIAYGLNIHTQGWGASFKYQQHQSYKLKRIYNLEVIGLRHPKQQKVLAAFDENSKSFFFGKINSLTNVRLGISSQRAIALKEVKKGVQLAWVYAGGVNLGLLKPIYLEVFDDGSDTRIQERYDPEYHTYGTIYGRGSFFKGVDEISVIPGVYGKLALNFEYSPYDEKLKSMEVGVAMDWFYKEVPLMYDTYNNQYWITFYLLFEVGKKLE